MTARGNIGLAALAFALRARLWSALQGGSSNIGLAILALALVLSGACGPTRAPTSPAAVGSGRGEEERAGPRGTLKIAWPVEPPTLSPKFTVGQAINEYVWVFNSFLTYYDLQGVPHAMLAQEIPTRERGDWVVNLDGTMVTTYRLRPARWHDDTPVTARDFAFGFEVHTDRELPVIQREPEQLMLGVEAPDEQTVVVRWKEPYIRANVLGYRELNPLPRHLLEEKYRTNKAGFAIGDDWTSAYVGTGPFRLDRWSPGTGMVARANLDWVLGPPRLESLDIRFISDTNTLLANLLSGEVDMINSPGARASEAAIARDSWVARGHGYLKTWETRLTYMEFQYREVPTWQRAIADPQVRRALIHAVDRRSLADVITEGLGTPADAFIVPSDPLFAEVDRSIVKYPFDPNRAISLLEEAGWRASQPGALLTNSAGQTLEIEATTTNDRRQDATIVAGDWKTIGIDSRLLIIPPARERDREYRASFPAVYFGVRTISMDNFYWVSALVVSPQTGFVELNRGSFRDAEVDRLHNLTLTSFDEARRKEATISLHKRMAEIVAYGLLHYTVEAILAKNQVKGPVGNYGPQTGITWNVHEWEVT